MTQLYDMHDLEAGTMRPWHVLDLGLHGLSHDAAPDSKFRFRGQTPLAACLRSLKKTLGLHTPDEPLFFVCELTEDQAKSLAAAAGQETRSQPGVFIVKEFDRAQQVALLSAVYVVCSCFSCLCVFVFGFFIVCRRFRILALSLPHRA